MVFKTNKIKGVKIEVLEYYEFLYEYFKVVLIVFSLNRI